MLPVQGVLTSVLDVLVDLVEKTEKIPFIIEENKTMPGTVWNRMIRAPKTMKSTNRSPDPSVSGPPAANATLVLPKRENRVFWTVDFMTSSFCFNLNALTVNVALPVPYLEKILIIV
jgi:hypothetical protein